MERQGASRVVKFLFESWAPCLLRYLARLTGSQELAEDLIQEAFMCLYQELRLGTKIENPKGWTLRVVRNKLRKHKRDCDRERFDVEPETIEQLPSHAGSYYEKIAQVDELTRLLSVLTRREEEVILLRMQTLKYREIGEQLGISTATVGVLVSRALKKMQRASRARSEGVQPFTNYGRNISKTLQ